MTYRMALYPPSRWGGATSITNIQNNFYGSGSCTDLPFGNTQIPIGRSCYQPTCCYPYMNWLPPFLQNAMTRLMSYNLINSFFNPSSPAAPVTDPQTLLTDNLHVTDDELAEVNGRYDVQA